MKRNERATIIAKVLCDDEKEKRRIQGVSPTLNTLYPLANKEIQRLYHYCSVPFIQKI